MIVYADNFLAGSLLSLLLPTGLLIVIAIWYVIAIKRVPGDTSETAPVLPPSDVVSAAGPAAHDVTPTDPPSGQAR